MEILILSRYLFDRFLQGQKVTPENVEDQKKVFFISINNQDDKHTAYFPEDKENVKVMVFPDTEQDVIVPIFNANPAEDDNLETVELKAFTMDQARDLFQFIKKHKDKDLCVLHCTAGVSRSGAVGTFINDYVGGNWNELMRRNPSIIPNMRVYKLLHDAWYEDHSHKDSFTGKPIGWIGMDDAVKSSNDFDLEVMNPKSQEQIVADQNARNPDQHTRIENMTMEDAVKMYPDAFKGKPLSWQLTDEAGQLPVAEYKGRGYQKGETTIHGMQFIHPDGSSTTKYVAGIDPYNYFEQFWLETDKFYSMIDKEDIEILRHAHPNFNDIFPARRKLAPAGEFEPFPSFGFGPEYTGTTLVEWLTEKNMLVHFK